MSKPLSPYQTFVITELCTSWETLIHIYRERDTHTHKHSYMHTNIQINRYIHIHHKLYGSFLWIGFNKIKGAEPL